MKKVFLLGLLLLVACSGFGGSDLPTTAPDALNILIAQTAAAAATETAAQLVPTLTPSLTPFPSLTPGPSPTVTPTFFFLLATPTATADTSCPYNNGPFYVRVRPFAYGSADWNRAIPDYPPNAPFGYPALLFLQHVLNTSSWTSDTEYINMSGSWLDAMKKVNGAVAWQYLQSPLDGTFSSSKLMRVDTFPGNVLLVVGRKFRRGQCWDEILTYPYSNIAPDLTSLPAYLIGFQTDMNYDHPNVVYPAPKNGGSVYVPILSKDGTLWLSDTALEPFPSVPVNITVTASSLDIRAKADPTALLLGSVPAGTRLTLTDYSPEQRDTWGQVIYSSSGQSGYVLLSLWSGSTIIYTTDWQMQTLPVPPG
jgi:hypothetical protein